MPTPTIPTTHTTRLSAGGRIVIPAEFRDSLGLKEGDALDLVLEEGEVRLVPRLLALRRAKARIRRGVGALRGSVAGLIAERTEQAARLERAERADPTEPAQD